MLSELRISNFAIIEEQRVQFGPGLNVISGQTGSGKSVLLNALELILGARPRAQLIRHGADHLEIEGAFNLSDLSPALVESLPDIARGDELVLSRSINQSGKGKVYINGRLGTVALLQEISRKLINICGQGQHINLLDPKFHLDLIDEYAGNAELRSEYAEVYSRYRVALKDFEQFESRRDAIEARSTVLRETFEELNAAKLYAGIREDLDAQTKKLEGAERLIEGVQAVLPSFSSEEGVLSLLSRLITSLNELSRFDSQIKEFVNQANSARVLLQELEIDLARYSNDLSLDDEKLALLRDKLAEVARLERKYRANDTGLLEIQQSAGAELDRIADLGNISDIKERLDENRAALERIAAMLSESRLKAGSTLAHVVEKDLGTLSMPEAKLKIEIEEGEFAPDGKDRVEFFISTNKGELFKPLAQIASGGELSRIMLVLKKNLRDRSGVNVLVFDEVDSGVSGSVARAVGQKLKELSKFSQVICITHLAQIASLAERHILVDKIVKDRTFSIIKVIEGEEKVDEIARMLAGYEITRASRESAKELLTSKT